MFSLIVPVYKTKYNYLNQCIESVLKQNYGDFELILIDDGSPDDCGKICDSYSQRDKRVKVIHKPNSGVSDSRNVGIQASCGDWIIFLDSDDWIEAETLLVLSNLIYKNRDLDAIIFNLYRDFKDNCVPSKEMYPEEMKIFTPDELIELRKKVLDCPMDMNVLRLTFCKAIRRDLLIRHGVEFDANIPLCEDVVFWFEAMQHVTNAVYIKKHLYHYRQEAESASLRFRSNIEEEHQIMLSRLYELIMNTGNYQEYRPGYALEVFYSMQRCIIQKFYHSAWSVSWAERYKACRSLFSEKPYKDCLKVVPLDKLSRNHRIKYFFIKFRMYFAVNGMRSVYLQLTKKEI